MPNWCSNTINITGTEEDLKKFLQDAEGEVEFDGKLEKTAISMEKMFPYPKDSKNDCQWAVKNWGTKWPMIVTIENECPGLVQIMGDTANSPPLAFFKKISKKYPSLKFRIIFSEPGNKIFGDIIFGDITVQNGE